MGSSLLSFLDCRCFTKIDFEDALPVELDAVAAAFTMWSMFSACGVATGSSVTIFLPELPCPQPRRDSGKGIRRRQAVDAQKAASSFGSNANADYEPALAHPGPLQTRSHLGRMGTGIQLRPASLLQGGVLPKAG